MFLIAGPHAARAGVNVWTTHGPYGRNATALAIDPSTPSTLYAATEKNGVFKSTNGGDAWNPANTGLSDPYGYTLYVTALAIDPSAPARRRVPVLALPFFGCGLTSSWRIALPPS